MYIRASSRRAKDGTVRYLQLAHSEWDADAGMSRPKILYSFGREDQLDRPAVERLIAALARLLDPATAAALTAAPDMPDLTVAGSRPLGGTYVLDEIWQRLRIGEAINRQDAGRYPQVERALFALTANRALAASSKLAAADWISNDVHVTGLDQISDDACYRAMDWLLKLEPKLAEQVYFQVTDLLNLEVDLLFFDTTSTYFDVEHEDDDLPRDKNGQVTDDPGQSVKDSGFRMRGKSKDSRDDPPQIVVGMAVTRDGIPVRVWSWPGNTSDSKLIRQVKDDMRAWSLSRIVYVADRGFSSRDNRRELMRGAGGYIIGEKLRSDSPEIKAALAVQGRYKKIRDNMHVKEVNTDSADRFVICYNPDQADRDAAIRNELITRLEAEIADSDTLSRDERAKLEGALGTKPGLKRFLRTTPGGLLRIDRDKAAAEAKLDGKYLLRCSDPHLSSEDIALGYKQLLEVERGWRDMKQIIDLRPVYHRREERIRAHVLLCWLALLLIRVAETTSGATWNHMRTELQRIHAVTFTGPAGTFRQATEPTKPQRDLLTALQIDPPKRIQAAIPATER